MVHTIRNPRRIGDTSLASRARLVLVWTTAGTVDHSFDDANNFEKREAIRADLLEV